MAFVQGSPVGGDAGDSISTAGNVGYGAISAQLGVIVAGTSPAVTTPTGYAGRFELEIPAGATIDSVEVAFTTAAAGLGATTYLSGGFLAVDSFWPSSGFNSATYATRASFPWPRRYNGSALVDNLGAFHGGAPAFSGSFPRTTAFNQPWSFGENTSPTHSVTGLVVQLQAFVDAEPANIRSGSSSATALPIAFSLVPSLLFPAGSQNVRTVDYGSTPPVLSVSYTPPPPGRVTATAQVRHALAATLRTRSALFAALAAGPAISAKLDTRSATTTTTKTRPATSSRGRVKR